MIRIKFKKVRGFDMTDATSHTQLADADDNVGRSRARIRKARWEDWALPAAFGFAVLVVLTLRYPLSFAPITAAAADPQRPDYDMTIIAKRLPFECRGSLQHPVPAACTPFLAGDAVIEMRETGSDSQR
jgi:hypothetical protein